MSQIKSLPGGMSRIKAEQCRRKLSRFVKEFWGTIISDNLVWANHLDVLCDELQLVAENLRCRKPKIHDLIINIPPGTSKTTLASVMFPVWCWISDPTCRFITGSYAEALSLENAELSRTVLMSDKFKLYYPEVTIARNQSKKRNYRNNQRGQRFSCSVGGAITGIHAHCIIIDDPLNPKQSVSDTQRATANTWLDKTLSMRKVDKAATVTIVIMQRLHELDCSGHLISKGKEKLKHICLPAELLPNVSPPELRKIYTDGLLDPNRMGRDVIAEASIDLGTYGKAGQFDQSPAPTGGGILKKEWFGVIEWRNLVERSQESGKSLVWNFAVDCAYTEKESNDPTGILSWATYNNNLYLRHCQTVRLEQPDLEKFLKKYVLGNGYTSKSRIFIEPKANGLSTAQGLKRRTELNVVIDKAPTKDKASRTRDSSPYIESGRVYLVEGPWNDPFIEEVTMFPNAAHDERVDILNIAIRIASAQKKSLTWGKR